MRQYICEAFKDNSCYELQNYLNDHQIKPEQIISISMSSDSEATHRIGRYDVDRILLVYMEA